MGKEQFEKSANRCIYLYQHNYITLREMIVILNQLKNEYETGEKE